MSRLNVLILCLDNVGRSPLTHAILRQYHKLSCLSAGFDSNGIGKPCNPVLVKEARALGIDLSKFRATYVQEWMLKAADFFVVHDAADEELLRHCLKQAKIKLNRDRILFVGSACYGKFRNVLDPVTMALDFEEYNQEIDCIVMGAHALGRELSR